MKALTFRGRQTVAYESIPDPVLLKPTDVVVKVKVCAICGSDLHVYQERERGIDPGTAMGHEFCGEITEVGKAVKNFRVGDRVMSPFTTNCGSCYYCTIGLTCRCEQGQLFGWREQDTGLHGGQAEYVRVPLADSTLMHIPDDVSWEEGLMLGDIIATGFYCARQAEIKPEGTYTIIGCGPVGLMSVLGAREYGAEKIFAIDTVPERLAKAKAFGAQVIDAGKGNPAQVIRDYTQGRGADAVLEVVGSTSANRLAFEILRPGGILSSVGVCTDAHLAFSPLEAYNKNVTYKTGRCPARFMMEQLVPVIQQKKYDFTSIITHRLPLQQGPHGYDIFANKKENCLKVLLEMP
jgi:threonine dehydrogenase-like Zn-dependent dehydrogenase